MNKIPYEERCEVYAAARKKFGAHMQTMVAIEEMSEVIKSIVKWHRTPVKYKDNAIASIIEEVADATIMLEQLRQIFNINESVLTWMDYKLAELKRRINK